MQGVSLTYRELSLKKNIYIYYFVVVVFVVVVVWVVSLTHPILVSFSFLYGGFLLHVPCWLHYYVWSFS